MFGKAYESMYSGSMVGSGLNVFAVWNYIIANTHFSVIELNPRLLQAILGGELREVEKAIEFLCAPDPQSRSKLEEGRRLIREGQFQYRVVNWAEYQAVRTANDLREYNRRKQAEYRARKRALKQGGSGPLPGEVAALAAEERGDQALADKIAENSHQGPVTMEERMARLAAVKAQQAAAKAAAEEVSP
jgi:hypothetical protein